MLPLGRKDVEVFLASLTVSEKSFDWPRRHWIVWIPKMRGRRSGPLCTIVFAGYLGGEEGGIKQQVIMRAWPCWAGVGLTRAARV